MNAELAYAKSINSILAKKRLHRNLGRKTLVLGKILLPVVLVLTTVSAWGYMVDFQSAVNKFFVGQDDIAICEEFSPPQEIYPGMVAPKRAWIENKGDVEVFVRAMCVFSDSEAERLGSICGADLSWSEPDEDGWRYLETSLKAGEISPLVCEGVSLAADEDVTKLKPLEVYIVGESVQAEGFSCAREAFDALAGGVKDDETA